MANTGLDIKVPTTAPKTVSVFYLTRTVLFKIHKLCLAFKFHWGCTMPMPFFFFPLFAVVFHESLKTRGQFAADWEADCTSTYLDLVCWAGHSLVSLFWLGWHADLPAVTNVMNSCNKTFSWETVGLPLSHHTNMERSSLLPSSTSCLSPSDSF